MRAATGLVAAISWVALSGCAYHNVIYNGERIFALAEAEQRDGGDDEARLLYETVIDRMSAAYRSRPDAPWADEALLLIGRSHLRLGNDGRAEQALVEAQRRTSSEELRASAAVYLLSARGEVEPQAPELRDAFEGRARRAAIGEAHLMRARGLLEMGFAGRGHVGPGPGRRVGSITPRGGGGGATRMGLGV